MRLWSLHPRYLDAKGLVALWREALLAQRVLSGKTGAYRHHPQLTRFTRQADPLAAIGAYLRGVLHEADRRGYHFDAAKILLQAPAPRIAVTQGQLGYELRHLNAKLKLRDPAAQQIPLSGVEPHPVFYVVAGEVEEWERISWQGMR